MNRAELVEILASKNDLSKTAASAALETLIDTQRGKLSLFRR